MEVLDGPVGLDPVRVAIRVAGVLGEEGADALWSEVGDTVFTRLGQDDRVRDDSLLLINAALEIAEKVVSEGAVVAEVTQCLHDLGPVVAIVAPTRVAVELLVVLDERFRQGFGASRHGSTRATSCKRPDLGNVDFD